jgi:hypothetical protein
MDDLTKLLRALRRHPDAEFVSRNRHLKVRGPRGTISIPLTPSDSKRALRNTVAALRRIGIELPR